MRKYGFVLVAFLLACGGNSSKSSKSVKHVWSNEIYGIPYKISYVADKQKDYQQQIDSLIRHYVNMFSEKNPQSLVSQLNNSSSLTVSDKDFLFLMKQSLKLCQTTNGNFDVTIKPLYDLFTNYTFTELISKSLDTNYYQQLIGCNKLSIKQLNGGNLLVNKENKNVKLTLGGIYKGFIVDKVADFLKKNNVTTYYVEFGNTPHVKCNGEVKHQWDVVIKEPQTDSSLVYHSEKMIINLENKGLACSDVSVNAYRLDTLVVVPYFSTNPIGLAKSDIINAIVIAEKTMIADALATAFIVMGKEKTLDYLKHHSEIDAIITYLDGESVAKYITPTLKDKFHTVN